MMDEQKDKAIILRYMRHCVVLTNAILSLAFVHYAVYLGYSLYNWFI